MGTLSFKLMPNEVYQGEFYCGNNSIETSICSSYYATLLKQAYAYQICDGDIVVGYYMIYLKRINLDIMERLEDDEYNSGVVDGYTSAHISYIAIADDKQHNKYGTYALKGIIKNILLLSKNLPIRLITLDALSEYENWYYDIGFRKIPGMDNSDGIIPMYMDCMSREEKNRRDEYCQVY